MRGNQALIVVTLSAVVGCQSSDRATDQPGSSPAALSGQVSVGGSTTVLPISQRMATAFQKQHSGVKVVIEGEATHAGFTKFCSGQADIVGASRPINAAENDACAANRVDYFELPIAFDALSVVANAKNSFVDCLTVGELKTMWEPAAQGSVTRWNQVRSGFPNQPLALFGPGKQSGTYDYFTLAIVGTEGSSRNDYTTTTDDTVLAQRIADEVNALGFFGYAYYQANKERLKLVGVDAGEGCVGPTPESVAENRYRPLSRPIFIYVSESAAQRPAVRALAHFYLLPEQSQSVHEVGYTPLPVVGLLTMARRFDEGTTGSLFGGRGAVVGLTADLFQDEDRIKSALVR